MNARFRLIRLLLKFDNKQQSIQAWQNCGKKNIEAGDAPTAIAHNFGVAAPQCIM